MTTDHGIPKPTFNALVQGFIPPVRNPLLAVEAAVAELGLPADHPIVTNLALLHGALADVLAACDSLGSSGGVHTDTGGGNKGTSS